ncbi:MAG: ABC transporter permease [Bacteroidales bacterium]|nr:ABC transporter permease [Bacteroidales bacterium]
MKLNLNLGFSERRRKKEKQIDKVSSLNPDRIVLQRLLRNPVAIVSSAVIVFFILVAILGYWLSPDKTPFANEQHLEIAVKKPGFKVDMLQISDREAVKQNIFKTMLFGKVSSTTNIPIYSHRNTEKGLEYEIFTGDNPNGGEIKYLDKNTEYRIKTRTYPLGTDRYGRCLLSQLIIGTRVSVSVGFIAIIIAIVIGITLGALAGYFQGKIDAVIMWFINVVWSVPTILLVIAITFALGKGFWQIFVAVGLTMWVDIARMVRGQVLSLKEKEFVLAGKVLGFSNARIIIKHILPNVVNALTVIITSNFATAILQEAGLSFLGLGVQPPMPSWGSMIKENYGYIILDAAYMAIIPGLAIMILVLSFFMLGNAIRQATEIKQ